MGIHGMFYWKIGYPNGTNKQTNKREKSIWTILIIISTLPFQWSIKQKRKKKEERIRFIVVADEFCCLHGHIGSAVLYKKKKWSNIEYTRFLFLLLLLVLYYRLFPHLHTTYIYIYISSIKWSKKHEYIEHSGTIYKTKHNIYIYMNTLTIFTHDQIQDTNG